MRRFVQFVAFNTLLVAVAILLLRLGRGTLALPHSSWGTWFRTEDATTIVFTFIRVIALVADIYLFVTTMLLGVATLLRIRPLVVIASTLATPYARRITQRAVGLSLIGALSVPAIAGAAPTVAPVPTLHHLTPDEAFPTTTTTIVTLPSEPEASSTRIQVATQPSTVQTHVVMSGENLWGIADDELTVALGRRPTAEEVRVYWLKVIENNRMRLVQHENPDLIFPGQILQLPQAG